MPIVGGACIDDFGIALTCAVEKDFVRQNIAGIVAVGVILKRNRAIDKTADIGGRKGESVRKSTAVGVVIEVEHSPKIRGGGGGNAV